MGKEIKIPEDKRGLDPVVSSAILNTVNNFPFYVMLIDADHHILLVNNAIKQDLGVDPNQIIGGHCPKVVHGLNEPFPGCPLEEAVKKGHAIEQEFFDNKSGRWTMSAVYPTETRTLNDQAVYFHMIQDITEKKQAELKVLSSYQTQSALGKSLNISLLDIPLKKQLQLILNHIISIPWLKVERKGSIFLVEDDPGVLVMKAHFGLAPQLLKRCKQVSFGHCLCGRAALSGQVEFADCVDSRHENQYEGIPPHGHYCIPILSAGKVMGVINIYIEEKHKRNKREEEFLCSVADALAGIIKRKQAEENVKSAKDELQMIMDSVPALIIFKDIEGRVIRTNKTLANSLKMPVKDIVGKTTEELFPREQAEKMRKDDKEVIISGKPKKDIIQPYTTPEGTRWAITDKMPYKNKKGKVTGIISLSKDITVQKKSEQELKQAYQKLKKTMDAVIDTMSKIIEARDPYTSGHQHRVCQLAVSLARELGLPPDKVEGIRIASLIHDIGKISVPTEILSKTTTLSDIEFSLIKVHSQIGYDILKAIDFSYPVANILLQHHERLNGTGYPNNLKGDEILLEARILGVADVVEAMSSHRPYRPSLGIDAALEEISQNKDILYDPEVVDVCLKLFKRKGFKFE